MATPVSAAAMAAEANALPLNCISISDPDIQKSTSLLKQACLDSGFFYVIDYDISEEFMNELFVQSRSFFNLPLQKKMELLRNEKNRGYTPTLDETLDPGNQVDGDFKEGYFIGIEVPEDDPQAEKPFYGPNQWPSEDILPGWRQIMEQYQIEALRVCRTIAKIMALALDLDVDYFVRPQILGGPIATLKLLHYEGKVSDPARGIYGTGAHSDFGLLTLLAIDGVAGLQICKDKDARPRIWENVTTLKRGFIVNIGDLLERLTNDVFRSTLHRVVLDGQERYSIAFFADPSHEYIVECLPSCTSETNPPKYPPITCAAYISQRFKEIQVDLSSYHGQETSK